MPLTRIGYPVGVVVVFTIIFLSAFFSYRFFLVMIDRVTAFESLEAREGVTFHLDEYRAIAASLDPLTASSSVASPSDHTRSALAFRNAQSRNDRVILLQELLKKDGWSATVIDEKEIRSEQLTIIAAKEAHEKEAEALVSLLTKNGFIVVRGKPLVKEEKFDILITLGAY